MKTKYSTVRGSHLIWDSKFREFQKELVRKKTPCVLTCSSKCSFCCDEPVYVLEEEIRYILENYSGNLQDLKVRVNDWFNKVKDSPLYQKYDSEKLTSENFMRAVEWLKLKATCPFLVNGLCSVYSRRPISCRSHMVMHPSPRCSTENRGTQKFASIPLLMAQSVDILVDGRNPDDVKFELLGKALLRILNESNTGKVEGTV